MMLNIIIIKVGPKIMTLFFFVKEPNAEVIIDFRYLLRLIISLSEGKEGD